MFSEKWLQLIKKITNYAVGNAELVQWAKEDINCDINLKHLPLDFYSLPLKIPLSQAYEYPQISIEDFYYQV